MSKTIISIAAAAAALLLSTTAMNAQTIGYDASAQTGNQMWTGNLGMDFDVNSPIAITSLGAFNANGAAGFTAGTTISVAIYNRDTQTQVAGPVGIALTAGTLVNGDRFVSILPVVLPVGHYSVVAVGFNGNDLNGNSTCVGAVGQPTCFPNNAFTAPTENSDGGLISFVGLGRFDANTTLDFPTITPLPNSTQSNPFLAGTFRFNAAPTFTKAFGTTTITAGQTTTLTFTITNPNGNGPLTGLQFTDTLPGSLTVAPGAVSNTCGGVVTAVAGTNSISLTGGSIPAGPSTCTIVVNINAGPVAAATTLTNTSSTLTSHEAPPDGQAVASILVLPADAQLISYAANLGAGQSFIDVTNAGTVEAIANAPILDYLCVNVYTFAEDQQLISCCTCNLSPNDLQTLSVQNDLINNTLTPGVPIGVTVALVATDNPAGITGTCNAATVTDTKLAGGMRAWGTHLHAAPGGGFALTETPFSKVALSEAELTKMTSYCGFIQANGSHFGICNSCKQGAAGSTKK